MRMRIIVGFMLVAMAAAHQWSPPEPGAVAQRARSCASCAGTGVVRCGTCTETARACCACRGDGELTCADCRGSGAGR